jgi:AmmeMemoRadiSam system protein B/AmmeMemoRadiSam system protein A
MLKTKTLALLTSCFIFLCADCQSQSERIDRQPAVAGSFYPAKQEELSATLKQLFTNAVPSKDIQNVLAIISPHAGYVFSGEVAASAFNQIDPTKEYENIFLLGSSHYVAFEGASIYSQGNFITPLGTVKVNTKLANQLIKNNSIFSNRTDAHAREHSLEVQLPFLQYRLKKDFKIVPIVLGTQSPEICRRIAKALQPYFNAKNLFVISTDFSHYPSYQDAKIIDKATADAILTNSPENLISSMANYEQNGISNLATCLCGWTSVLTLMYMTEGNGDVEFTHIQYKNSGDTEYGEKNRVVGYNAIAVSLKEKKRRSEFRLSDKDKKDLLAIARNTVEYYVKNHAKSEIDGKNLSSILKTNCGTFVTLKKHGNLRGCIGRFDASEPLYKVVQDMAIASSTQDYRFSPVESDEIPELEIEISVLTPMRRINSINEIKLGKHGIYIREGNRSGTFLPQVAVETGWTKEEFLGHCAQDKAGIGWDGWKDAELYIYEALVFSEKEFGLK